MAPILFVNHYRIRLAACARGNRTKEDRILKLAEQHPAAAVMEAYKEIELLTQQFTVIGMETRHPKDVIRVLHSFGAIDDEVRSLFLQLRRTKHTAVHTAEKITTGEALEYRDLCKRLLRLVADGIERFRKYQKTGKMPPSEKS